MIFGFIGPLVLEENMFESVEGRQTADGCLNFESNKANKAWCRSVIAGTCKGTKDLLQGLLLGHIYCLQHYTS